MDRHPTDRKRERSSRHGISRRVGAAAMGMALILGCDAAPAQEELPVGQYSIEVAMGDSYASGLGSTGDDNECRRSENGYAGLIAKALEAKEFINLACGGWNPTDVLNGKDGKPSQIDQLPANANLIMLSIGGNTVNLRDLGKACLSDEGCGQGSPAFENAMKVFRSDDYYAQVEEVCRKILEKAPNAILILVGYPKPIAHHPLLAKLGVTAFGEANDDGVDGVVTALDTAGENVVNKIRIDNDRIFYGYPAQNIDAVSTKIDTLFQGQKVYFHLDQNGDSKTTGHPNNLGYEAMKTTLLPQIAKISLGTWTNGKMVAR